MASARPRLDAWLQRTLAWWTNASAWPERLVILAFTLAAAGLAVLTLTWLSFWPALALWAVFIGATAFASRQGWLKLLGPVLFYDMVRTARRSRYSIMRIFYGCFLLFVLSYMFLMLYINSRIGGGRDMSQRALATAAELFFFGFILIQVVLVILLTPAYVAGAIAEEKDRKTLEFMLATDLANREIVLSKFFSRMANLTLLLITGLPVLSILQFVGGVDQELMLAGFAWIGLTMLGLGSVSILFSTLFQKPRDAISLTYLLGVAYAGLATFGLIMGATSHPIMNVALWFNDDPPTIRTILTAINAGNPLAVLIDVFQAMNGRTLRGVRTTLAAELGGILTRYAWFHLVLAVVAITWSILRVRAIALKQTSAGTTAKLRWWQRLRPPVGQFPMLWKEIFIEGRMKFNWLVWLPIIVLVALTLGIGVYIVGDHIYREMSGERVFMGRFDRRTSWERLGESMNIWFRIAGTGVACLLILMVGVRASTSITNERERDTFDALIASPLSAASMLFAKLVGNLLSIRLGLIWFGSMLLLAIVTGGVHPIGVPIIVVACCVYAVVMTMIGLAYSMTCKTSLQSAVFTVLTSIFVGGAHWLLTTCFCMPAFGLIMMAINLNNMGGGNRAMNEAMQRLALYFAQFQAGITPPFVIAFNSFSWREMSLDAHNGREYWEFVAFSQVGLFLWLVASAVLWFAILVPTFRRLTRRDELIND